MVKDLINKSITSRFHAYEIIRISLAKESQLSYTLNNYLDKLNSISNIDKRFITMLVQGSIRLWGRLDWEIKQVYTGQYHKLKLNIKIILRLGVYQLLFMNKIPDYAAIDTSVKLAKKIHPYFASLTNAILRSVSKNKTIYTPSKNSEVKELSEYLSHPEWLVKKWINDIGFIKAYDLINWNNTLPIFWFRVNTSLYSINSFKKYLDDNKIIFSQFDELKEFFKISKHQLIIKSEIFIKGFISVQDPSAGLVVNLLNPEKGDNIIDACSAPGGKTSYISEKIGRYDKILSYDIDKDRLKKLSSNLLRLKIPNVQTKLKDVTKDKLEKTYKMLLDVPCSGTGVISKKPDIKWRRSENNLHEMSSLQKNILWNAAKYILPGGVIVYSSCSIEPEENNFIIEEFLLSHPKFSLEPADLYISKKFTDSNGYMSTKPYKHNIDGSFAARLRLDD